MMQNEEPNNGIQMGEVTREIFADAINLFVEIGRD